MTEKKHYLIDFSKVESYNDIQKIEFWNDMLKGEVAGGVFND